MSEAAYTPREIRLIGERDTALAHADRLRALIKAAEWSGGGPEQLPECPWCGVPTTRPHASCDAFTPEGEVR